MATSPRCFVFTDPHTSPAVYQSPRFLDGWCVHLAVLLLWRPERPVRYSSVPSRSVYYRCDMGYNVHIEGRLRMSEDKERAAFEALRGPVLEAFGPVPDEWVPTNLDELFGILISGTMNRDGEDVVLGMTNLGDPKWHDESHEFFVGLAPFVDEGSVMVYGEQEGEDWSYSYGAGGYRHYDPYGMCGQCEALELPDAGSPPPTGQPIPPRRRWWRRF